MTKVCRSRRVAAGAVLLICLGCGGGDAPELGEVGGVVTMDGTPFKGATVSVIPQGGRPSKGVTDAEGRYILKYTRDVEGARLGTHPIRVEPPRQEPEGAENMSAQEYDMALRKQAMENPVPKEWRDGTQKITIEPGSQQFDIKMVSK